MQETRISIPIHPFIWLPCKECKLTTRHFITNPDDCQERAIFQCGYKCKDTKFLMAKEFYTLFYNCGIDENDNRLVFNK